MGWNTAILAVKGRSVNEVLETIDVVYLTGHEVSADVASTHRLQAAGALATINGWCIIFSPGGGLVGTSHHRELSHGTIAVGFQLASVSSIYAFGVFEDGVERRWIQYDYNNQVVEERGVALPEEHGIQKPRWGYDEDWAFTLLRRLTGVTWELIMPQPFAVFSVF